MWSLPDDLVETILLRLPAVDLVRCNAVTKVWRSLISSADFVAAHLERAKSDPQFLLVRDPSAREPVTDHFSSFGFFSSRDLLFVGSVNGLICVSGKGYVPYQPLTPDDVWIINPVTGLSMKLPYSSSDFYVLEYNVKFAFWCHDEDDGVYKLAKLSSNSYGETLFELWVSTSPDTWSVISTLQFNFHSSSYFRHSCDVLIEGVAAYWICGCDFDYESMEYNEMDYNSVVVSLDLKTLALNMFIPQWYTNTYCWMPHNEKPNSLLFGGNLNGEFVLAALRSSDDGRYYDIWTLAKDDDDTGVQGWINKFIICLDSFPFFDKCIGIVNDKLVLANDEETVVALCDPFTGMLEGVETLSEKFYMGSACGFVGSLVSMNGFRFESHELLRQSMNIKLPPYSSYPSSKEEGRRMKSSEKQRRQ